MPTVIDLDEARPDLADIYDRARGGEEIVIVRREGPRIKLVIVDERPMLTGERQPGRYRGQFTVPDSFFEPLCDQKSKDRDP